MSRQWQFGSLPLCSIITSKNYVFLQPQSRTAVHYLAISPPRIRITDTSRDASPVEQEFLTAKQLEKATSQPDLTGGRRARGRRQSRYCSSPESCRGSQEWGGAGGRRESQEWNTSKRGSTASEAAGSQVGDTAN